jgi:hypothetical protein
MSAKPDSTMLFKHVKATLLKEWDPIDISDNPHLTDEYDSYVPEIVRLVTAGHSPQELADHLKYIEETLSVVPPEERRIRTAALLVKLIAR